MQRVPHDMRNMHRMLHSTSCMSQDVAMHVYDDLDSTGWAALLEYDSLRGPPTLLAASSSSPPSLMGEGASRSLPRFTTLVSLARPCGRSALALVEALIVLGGFASLSGMGAPPGVQLCSRTRAA